MADSYTTFTGMANDAPNVYIARKMIELLSRTLVLDKCSDSFPLENGNSKTLRVVRVKRVSLPNTPLLEGITPSTDSLTLENVDVTVEQWGLIVTLTDMLELTVQHPMMSLAIERVAMAMKETSEREDAEVLMGATNVTFPGAVTTRSGLAATDIFNTALAIAINAKLEMRGANKYMNNGGYYMGFFQPPHKAAILGSDDTFKAASNFAQQDRLMYGRVGEWMGIEWIMGNFLPVYVGVAAATTAAATATKAQYTVGTSGTLATANYQLKVVAREVTTDYERRISVQTGNIAVTSPGSISVVMPSSVNYVYDVYLTQAAGTIAYLVASRQAASSTFTITTAPAGTEAVAPEAPALGINVYTGFVVGKGAFGTCTLNGMSLQTFTTPKGPTDSDALAQRRKVGVKYARRSFILDNSGIERFETGSAFAAAIPA